jgi:negative regulator of flagellin synthesis FlgM
MSGFAERVRGIDIMINEIRGSGVNFGTSPIGKLGNYSESGKVAKSSGTPVGDSVEISDLGALRSKYDEMPTVRMELVAQVRAQLADGTYETPEKMDLAIESLFEDLT